MERSPLRGATDRTKNTPMFTRASLWLSRSFMVMAGSEPENNRPPERWNNLRGGTVKENGSEDDKKKKLQIFDLFV